MAVGDGPSASKKKILQEMCKHVGVKWVSCTSYDSQIGPRTARQEQPHLDDCVRLSILVGQIAENEHACSHQERTLVKTTANA